MKKSWLLVWVAVFVLAMVTSSRGAMENAAKILEGTVTSITAGQIVVQSKIDKNSDRTQQVSLEINDQTKLNDLASLGEIKAGDQVSVYYTQNGDRNVATAVGKSSSSNLKTSAGATSGSSQWNSSAAGSSPEDAASYPIEPQTEKSKAKY